MKDVCHHCKFRFEETTVQAWRRRKDGIEKICPDCQRISRAEAAHAKRLHKKENPPSPLQILKKKHGKLSVTLVRMKLRLSYEDAKNLLEKEGFYDDRRNEAVHADSAIL
jgi:hypothetical protein